MKPYLFLIAILFIFASCDQVVFEEPQPRKVNALQEIPLSLQGAYLDQDGDTLYVYKNFFTYDHEHISMDNIYLSDSSVLKKYKNHYFYSTPIQIGTEDFWLTYILYLNDDGTGIDLYAMDPGDIVKLAKLQEITSKVRDIEEGDQQYYLFAPKKKDYKKIIMDSIFTKIDSFVRINPGN